jgi:regulator of protease activity HflC (stomatin/prohibitin superfamily)
MTEETAPAVVVIDRSARRTEVEAKVRVAEKSAPTVGQGPTIIVLILASLAGLFSIFKVGEGIVTSFIASQTYGAVAPSQSYWWWLVVSVVAFILLGFVNFQHPNSARVFTLFGNYIGTVSKTGLYMVPVPFLASTALSLAQANFESASLKINDKRGNPLSVSAIVVYRVNNPAQAIFSVANYTSYLATQVEAALRQAVAQHPYSSAKEGESSLLLNSDEINDQLTAEIAEAVVVAGIEIVEARINNLAYSVEIAQAMLQVQAAEAILEAREVLVEGSVGIVEKAVERLEAGTDGHKPTVFNDEQRVKLTTNLLTVLVGERSAQPVIEL